MTTNDDHALKTVDQVRAIIGDHTADFHTIGYVCKRVNC